MITEGGLKAPEVARRLSIPKSTITYWVRAEKKGKLSDVGSSKKVLTETEMELASLKRELAQVKMERDFLKKQPRTLPRSRSQVRADAYTATLLYHSLYVSYAEGIAKRLLCIA